MKVIKIVGAVEVFYEPWGESAEEGTVFILRLPGVDGGARGLLAAPAVSQTDA